MTMFQSIRQYMRTMYGRESHGIWFFIFSSFDGDNEFMLLRLSSYVDNIFVKPSVCDFQRSTVIRCNAMRTDAENSAVPEHAIMTISNVIPAPTVIEIY